MAEEIDLFDQKKFPQKEKERVYAKFVHLSQVYGNMEKAKAQLSSQEKLTLSAYLGDKAIEHYDHELAETAFKKMAKFTGGTLPNNPALIADLMQKHLSLDEKIAFMGYIALRKKQGW